MEPSVALRAGIFGHLVGDAIGVPFEFLEAGQIGGVEMRGYGTHRQPLGTWSDDGALTLALADSLLSVGFDPEDQGGRFLAWFVTGTYTPDDDGRFDIGGTTAAGMARLQAGTAAVDAGGRDEWDCGNGSLMRVLPLALIDVPDDEVELAQRAHLASRVTHGHARCQVACAAYVLTARRLIIGERSRLAALARAMATLKNLYKGGGPLESHEVAFEELAAWSGRSGSGYVCDSFWSAWEAFVGADSYRSTVERAVGYGGDTDTTAAIAGGLAGIYWGLEEGAGGIPEEWLMGLRGRDIVEEMLGRMG